MTQPLLIGLVILLLHVIVKFSISWKALDLCDDIFCRSCLAVAIIMMLGGAIDVAVSVTHYGTLVLIVGQILFFFTLLRRPNERRKMV